MAFSLGLINILHTRGAAAHVLPAQGYISFMGRRKQSSPMAAGL
jgi:hypothetical protein